MGLLNHLPLFGYLERYLSHKLYQYPWERHVSNILYCADCKDSASQKLPPLIQNLITDTADLDAIIPFVRASPDPDYSIVMVRRVFTISMDAQREKLPDFGSLLTYAILLLAHHCSKMFDEILGIWSCKIFIIGHN